MEKERKNALEVGKEEEKKIKESAEEKGRQALGKGSYLVSATLLYFDKLSEYTT